MAKTEESLNESASESQQLSASHVNMSERLEKLEIENEKLTNKNQTLSEILNENEQGWNQKFSQQKEEFEQYAQQAYQVRAHYDQLLFAYNEKVEQNTNLEKTIETLKEEVSKLEEQMIDMASMAPMSGASIEPEAVMNSMSAVRATPDLLQLSSPKDSASSDNSQQAQIDQLNSDLSQLKSDVDEKDERMKKLEVLLNDKVNELSEVKLRNEKLSPELVRLRNHMLQIEEGYTQEALMAEEREKQLRTKLFQVEENLQRATSSSGVLELVSVFDSTLTLKRTYIANTLRFCSSEMLSKMADQEAQIYELVSSTQHLELQLRDMTDQMNLYKDASQNLQLVLENFQKGDENCCRIHSFLL